MLVLVWLLLVLLLLVLLLLVVVVGLAILLGLFRKAANEARPSHSRDVLQVWESWLPW